MKTHKFAKFFIVLIVLFIAGCGYNYEVKTIIYADGSCLRTLIVTYEDSIDKFYERDYPIPIDTTWNLVIETDTNEKGDTVFVHKATKLFESVEHLSQLYDMDSTKHGALQRSVILKKRFRWFYTFFDYQETYEKLFNQPSLKTYLDSTHYNYAMLSDSEQKKYLEEHFDSVGAKQFDDRAEKGLNVWLEFTFINSCLDAVEKSVGNIAGWSINESEFTKKRDSIINLIDGELEFFENDDDIFDAIKRVFSIDSVLYQKLESENDFKIFMDKFSLWEDVVLEEEYVNNVVMPGLIIETNSTKISDSNQVEWNVGWANYFTDDYEMKVTSRIINIWSFWVSGGFILLLLIIVLIRRLNNRIK
ncbi:MAG: hypothetical protein PF485_14600 [Bacteroidales bacterium]|jgi:hypothetical protein|nr:hypothetical protein [Bacteroidales bacterium]